jgi:PKD repeat protein
MLSRLQVVYFFFFCILNLSRVWAQAPTALIAVNGNIIAKGSSVTTCAGTTLNFSDTSINRNTRNWIFKHGTPGTSTAQNPSVIFNTPGTDTVFLYAANTGTDTSFIRVIVNPIPATPVLTISAATICSNDSALISTTAVANNYFWLRNGMPFLSNTSNQIYSRTAGSYSLQVQTNGCLSAISAPVGLTVNQSPDASILDPITNFRNCGATNSSPNFLFNIENNSSTAASNTSYQINWGDGSPLRIINSWGIGDSAEHLYTSVGSFNLSVSVTSNTGCITQRSYNVFNGTNPTFGVANPGSTNGCAPQTFTYTLDTNTRNNTPSTYYFFQFNDGSNPEVYTQSNLPTSITHTFTQSPCTRSPALSAYQLFAYAKNICDSTGQLITAARISEKPTADFTIAPNDTICQNNIITFTSTSLNGVFNSGTAPLCDTALIRTWQITPGVFGTNWTYTGSLTNRPSLPVTFLLPGTYSIRLAIRHSGVNVGQLAPCNRDTIIKTVCINPIPVPTFTLNRDTGCGPLSVSATNTSNTLGSCGPTQYRWRVTFNGSVCAPSIGSWSFTGGTDSTSTNPQFVFNNTGTYGITLTVINPCSTVTGVARIVSVKSKAQAVLVPQPDFCGAANLTATFNPNPPNNCYAGNPIAYNWQFTGGTPATSTAQNPNLTYTTPGTYPYVVDITNDCGVLTLRDTFVIHPLPPKVNITGGGAYCAGGAGVLIGTDTSYSGLRYQLIRNGVAVGSTIIGNGAALNFGLQTIAGTYRVVATNLAVTPNCSDTMNGSATVVVNTIPGVPAVNDTTICAGNIAILNINATGTITWYDSIAAGNLLHTGLSFTTPVLQDTTSYYVMRTVAGCNSARSRIRVNVNRRPELNTNRNMFVCSGSSLIISPTATINGTTYQFTATLLSGNANGFSSDATPRSGNISQTIINADTTFAIVRYILTPTANGCVGPADTVDVTIRPKPIASINGTDSICSGSQTSITGVSNISQSFYGWSATLIQGFASGFSSVAASTQNNITQTIQNDSNILARVRYRLAVVKDGCVSDSVGFIVNVKPSPRAIASGDSICSGAGTNINLSSNITGTRFIWTTSPVAGITGNRDSLLYNAGPIQDVLINSTGTPIAVNYLITPNAQQCLGSTLNKQIIVKPLPSVLATNDTTCSGQAKSISLNATISGSLFTWNAFNHIGSASGATSQTTPVAGPISQTINNSASTPATVRYEVRATLNGCAGAMLPVFLQIKPLPVANATSDQICSGDTNQIQLSSNIPSTFYTWIASGSATGFTSQGSPAAPPIRQRLFINGVDLDTQIVRYTITPVLDGCNGLPVQATTIVKPRPVMNPASAEICDGASTNIVLGSNLVGTQYTWIVTTNPLIGNAQAQLTPVSGPIVQTLTNSGNVNASINYVVTPILNGCTGNNQNIPVTVKPRPTITVSATPTTICSGQILQMNLSSNMAGVTYNWTSTANPIGSSTGQSSRNNHPGPIADTIRNNTTNPSNITYQIVALVNGCTSAAPVNRIITVNPLPAVNAGQNDTFCNQNTQITLSGFSPSGGIWTGAGVTSTGVFNPSVAGNGSHPLIYTVTNTSTNCSNSDTILILVTSPIQVNAGLDQFKCLNDAAFNITGTPAGGLWSGSSRVTPSGVYAPTAVTTDTLIYTRGSGSCQTYDTAIVFVRPLPPAIVGLPQNICAGQTVSIGGANNISHTYAWTSNPAGYTSNLSNPSISPTVSTRYVLTETNNFGCVKRDSVFISVLPAISNNVVASSQVICIGQTPSTIFGTTPSGGAGSGSYAYQWQDSTGGGVFNNITGAVGPNYTPGSLTQTTSFRRLVTSGLCNGAQTAVSNVVRIEVVGNISNNNISTNQTICSNQQPVLISGSTPAGGSGNYSYRWLVSADNINWSALSNADTLINYQPGVLTSIRYYRRIVFSATCQDTSAAVTINVLSPIANNQISSSVTICAGQLSPLLSGTTPTGATGANYQYVWQSSNDSVNWFNISGATAIHYQPGALLNTTYFRRLVNNAPCAGSQGSVSNVLKVTVLPVIAGNNVSSSQTICPGIIPGTLTGSIPVGASGIYNYQWQVSTDGISWINSATISANFLFNSTLNQTSYFRRVVNSSSCIDTSNILQITLVPAINNNIISGDTTFCALNKSDSIRGSIPTGAFIPASLNYQWQDSLPGGQWNDIVGANQQNLAPRFYNVTTFIRRLVRSGTTTVCVSSSNLIQLVVNPKPQASFTKNDTCFGFTAFFQSTSTVSSGSITNYNWSYGDGNGTGNTASSTTSRNYATAGSYTATLVVTTAAGCRDTTTRTVIIHPKPVATYSASNACFGFANVFQSTSNVAVGSSISTHQWTFGDASAPLIGVANTNKTYASAGTYQTRLIVTTNNGCKDSAFRTVVVNPKPSANFTFNIVCLNQTSQFTNTSSISSGSIARYQWNFDDNTTDTVTNPNKVYAAHGTYQVSLLAVSDSLCRDSITKAVEVRPLISGNGVGSAQTICQGDVPAPLIPSGSLAGGTGIYTYQWQSSADSLTWQNLANGNNTNYVFGTPGLTQTAYYRRIVNSGPCSNISNPIKITVIPIIGNNLIGSSQTICFSQQPARFVGPRPAGGNGIYTYIWESSSDSLNWNAIAASNDTAYQAPALTSTQFFRRRILSGPCNAISNVIKVTVLPAISGNTISGNQILCTNQSASTLVSTGAIQGGSGIYLYQWQTSTDSVSWSNIFGATNAQYNPGVPAVSLSYYRRLVSSGPCANSENSISNVVSIRVLPLISNNTVTGNQTICSGQQPSIINGTIPNGGNGNYTYQWQSSTDSINWSNISGQSGMNLQASILFNTTWFRRVVSSGPCSDVSLPVKINVLPPISGNNINGNQTICFGQTPTTIIGMQAVGGSGGNYQYIWQDSSSSSGWTNIIGAIDTSFSPPSLTATRYYRRIASSGPCAGQQQSISSIVTIIVLPPIANNQISSSQLICQGSQPSLFSGSTPTGGNNLYTYGWQISNDSISWNTIPLGANGLNYQAPVLNSTTWYRRFVTSGPCSQASNFIRIDILPQISNNIIQANQFICSRQQADTIRGAIPVGGNGSLYTYQWQQSADSLNWQPISGAVSRLFYPGVVNSTTFYRRVVNSGVCEHTSNVIKVFTHPLPVVNYQFANQCYPDSFSFQQTATIPTGQNVSYVWSLGDGSNASGQVVKKQYTTAGSYAVKLRVISDQGCSDSLTQTAVLHPKPIANFNVSNVCFPSTSVFIDSSIVSTGNITSWNWIFGDGGLSNLQNPLKSYGAAGGYQVSLIAGTNHSCRDTVIKNIQVYPKPRAVFGFNEVCFPNATQFTDSSSISTGFIQSYSWKFSNGDTSILRNPLKQFTPAGNYIATLKVVSDNFCSDSIAKNISVNPLPLVSFNTDTLSCANTAKGFVNSSTGANTYLWRFGEGSTSTLINPTHSYTTSGDYQVKLIAFSGKGCKDSLQKTIEIIIPPVANFSLLPDSGCSPLNVLFTNQTTGKYLNQNWNFGNGNVFNGVNPSVQTYIQSLIQDTLYFIQLTANNLCGTSVKRDTVKVFPIPVANFRSSVDSGCSPLYVTFQDLTTGYPKRYYWDFGNGQTSLMNNPPTQVFTTEANDSSFSVKLIVSNDCGADTITKVIKVKKNSVRSFFTASTTSGCAPLTVSFTDNSTGNIFTSWDFGDGNTASTKNATHTFTQPGQYTVRQFAGNGCSYDTSLLIIQVLPSPNISYQVQPPILCSRQTVQFINNTAEAASFMWYIRTDSFNTRNAAYVFSTPGKHAVRLKATSFISGCVAFKTDTIEINNTPVASFNIPLTICLNQDVNFTNTSQNANFNHWQFGDNTQSALLNPTKRYQTNGNYTIRLKAISGNGCADSISRMLSVLPVPDAAFTFDPKDACDGPQEVTFSNSSTGAISYVWKLASGVTSNDVNPKYTYIGVGKYDISLIAENVFGCKDTAYGEFNIIPKPRADFTANKISGCEPLEVRFNNTSTNAFRYQWSFGNAQTDTSVNPSVWYSQSGLFDISLLAIGQGSCRDSIRKTAFIEVYPKPRAAFTYEVRGNPPREVQFTNTSSGNELMYVWDFGNGSMQQTNEKDPRVRYDFSKKFPVQLIITSDKGCIDTATAIVDINVPGSMFIPNAFAPNNMFKEYDENKKYMFFIPAASGLLELNIEVYDVWGKLVWKSKTSEVNNIDTETTMPNKFAAWNGDDLYGNEVPQGVFVWKIEAVFVDGSIWQGNPAAGGIKSRVGDVTLIR